MAAEPAERLPARLFWLWTAPVALLAAASFLHLVLVRRLGIADVLLREQDVLVLGLTFALLAVLRIASAPRIGFPAALQARAPWLFAAFAVAVGWAGWSLVCRAYPLSLDEFLASFDTRILARGAAMASIPEPWRPFASALQPLWRMRTVGDTHWASLYLPVNAAFRALFLRLGAEGLTGGLWAGLSCLLTWRIARKLWPERRDAAVVATALLAASSQLLVTGMTPYAMSAHLALNLAWLALFLEDRPWSHAGAIAVGALACGLHQIVFHPLFVAPFLLELALARRWRLLGVYVVAYAVIGGLWTAYWSLALASVGAVASGAHGAGGGLLVWRVLDMLRGFDPAAVGTMAKHLLRFIAWQAPLTTPLALIAAPTLARRPGPLRALGLGIVLCLAAVFLLMPEQGLGWGYRYLHGWLGGLALIAAAGWVALTPDEAARARLTPALAVSCAAALLVLFPLRAWQATRYIAPYTAASRAIHATPGEVVVVDATGLRYGGDLVRNDPWLANTPKVMDLHFLTPAMADALCAGHSVAVFGPEQAAALGVPTFEERRSPADEAMRARLTDPQRCTGARVR